MLTAELSGANPGGRHPGLGAAWIVFLLVVVFQLPAAGVFAQAAGDPALTPKPGDRWVDVSSGIAFRYIPPGSFTMGSPRGEPGRSIKEEQHEVTLTRGYWISETEINQDQWLRFMGKNPSRFDECGLDCPVENVTWFQALKFCNALSESAGLQQCYTFGKGSQEFAGLQCNGFRLPTEAEWERAARAGTESTLFTGQLTIGAAGEGPELDTIAWYTGNSGVEYKGAVDCSWWKENTRGSPKCGTHPVGHTKPSQWKVHDMLGNVWEWTWDGVQDYPSGSVTDPVIAADRVGRITRGCAWDSGARDCRAANRGEKPAKSRSPSVGVRVVRTAIIETPETSEE